MGIFLQNFCCENVDIPRLSSKKLLSPPSPPPPNDRWISLCSSAEELGFGSRQGLRDISVLQIVNIGTGTHPHSHTVGAPGGEGRGVFLPEKGLGRVAYHS
jgi:hypothetical protein